MHKRPALIAILLLLGACSTEDAPPAATSNSITKMHAEYGCTRLLSNPVMVTIEQLLASPAKYEGRAVRFDGYYFRDFEHVGIYPAAEDGPQFHTDRGLWVLEGLPERYIGRRVTVEGIFTARSHGHIGQWPATICNVRGFAPR